MNGRRIDLRFAELSYDPVGTVFGAGEYQSRIHVFLAKQVQQQPSLVPLVDPVVKLRYPLGGGLLRLDGYPSGIVQDFFGKRNDLLRHGCTKEERLPPLGKQFDDAPDIVDKAHIKHVVGFVQYKIFDAVERNIALSDQIKQTTGSGDQNIDAPLNFAHLCVLFDPSKDDRVAEIGMFSVAGKTVVNLNGQFPGRGDDEGLDMAFFVLTTRTILHSVQDRKSEGGRFTGTGLCHPE